MNITKATRQGVKPLVGIYGESGTGKTYSALLLARGFVGPSGRPCLVDSESGRGSLYADVLPGGYDVAGLEPPFTPARYIEAIDAVESAGYSIGILDSGSHEWELGVLDLAAANEERSGKAGLHNWRAPKAEHAKFMLRLLRSKIPWIVCLRAKHKSRQGKDERGKTVIIRDEFTSPIQSEEFLFEMTAHGETLADHSFRLTKHSHPTLKDCFPVQGPITVATGEALARWCAAPGSSPPADGRTSAKAALWKLAKPIWIEQPEASRLQAVEVQLRQWKILAPSQTLADLSAEQLSEATSKLSIAIGETQT
jgi:hypothetical protein